MFCNESGHTRGFAGQSPCQEPTTRLRECLHLPHALDTSDAPIEYAFDGTELCPRRPTANTNGKEINVLLTAVPTANRPCVIVCFVHHPYTGSGEYKLIKKADNALQDVYEFQVKTD